MIRLPRFEYRAPRTVAEAAELLAAADGDAMILAGGTDLLPNMKRRQQTPRTLVALGQIAELREHTNGAASGDAMRGTATGDVMRGNALGEAMPGTAIGDVMRRTAIGDAMRGNATGDVVRVNAIGGVVRVNATGDVVRVNAIGGVARVNGHRIGAGVTLSTLVRDAGIRRDCTALWEAAAQVATPHLRAMGTLGGNLCLDTRCNYYDQSYEWRKAIDFCMKKDGDRCWVATSSPTCLAVSSTDTAPALMALRARVTLVSAHGTRELDVADLYANDGMHYMTRRSDEILTAIHIPDTTGWRSTYWKLRRRGSFDFPVLGVAAAVRLARDGTVEDARIVLGAVASRPLAADRAGASLIGRPLTNESIAEAAALAFAIAKPMDNTDFALVWRKRVTRDFVSYALRDLRGDDLTDVRRRIMKRTLQGLQY